MQQRENEPEVGRDGRLPGEDELDLVLDPQVAIVDLVVERDDLVAELDVLGSQRVDRAADRPGDDLAHLLEAGLERSRDRTGTRSSSEPPRDVVLGPLVGRVREDLRRQVVLDEDAVAGPCRRLAPRR